MKKQKVSKSEIKSALKVLSVCDNYGFVGKLHQLLDIENAIKDARKALVFHEKQLLNDVISHNSENVSDLVEHIKNIKFSIITSQSDYKRLSCEIMFPD